MRVHTQDDKMQQDIHKQALLNTYDQNKNIDAIRRETSCKSIWQCFPHQELHNKLNILEKNFLNRNQSKINTKQNADKSQAYSLLQIKIRKNPYLTRDLRQKLEHFMNRYTQIHEINNEKRIEIEILRRQLNNTMKKTEKLTKELSLEKKQLVKFKEQNRTIKKTYSQVDNKLKLLWG